MVTFTDGARSAIVSLIDQLGGMAFRITRPEGSPLAQDLEFSLVDDEPRPDDRVLEVDGFRVFVTEAAEPALDGLTIDFDGTGFRARRPGETTSAPAPTGPIAERVQHVLEHQVNPGIAAHGGKITLVDVQDTVVVVEMMGGCQGCGMAQATLRRGVERMIKEHVPEVTEIRDVTDHAAGANPYY